MQNLEVMLAAGLIAVLAGFSQGLTGFGFALVFAPLAALMLPAQEVVLSALITGGIVGSLVVLETVRVLPWRRASPMLAAAVAAAPAGSAMLAVLEGGVLRVVIAITALAAATAFLLFRPTPVRREGLALAAAGALGGFLNACTSMGGPPAALTVANQRWGVLESRATLAMFNLLSYVVGLVFADVFGLLHGGSWLTAGMLAPAAIAGTLAGAWSARRISNELFRKVIVGAVAVTAMSTLVGAIWAR